MTKILHLIIAVIIAPTYLFSETATIYAIQSAKYIATGSACCGPNSLTNFDVSTMNLTQCIYWPQYEQCEQKKHTGIWRFDLSEVPQNANILDAYFAYNSQFNSYHYMPVYFSIQNGVISESMASYLYSGGDWTTFFEGYDYEIPISEDVINSSNSSGQLSVLLNPAAYSNPSIINYGTNAPRLVIEYESIIAGPSGLQYNIQGSSIMLTWDALTDADYYKLERSTDSLFIEGVETSYIQDNNYTDDNLEYNIEYFYRVAANIGFWTDYSNVASVIIENVSIVGNNDIPIVYKVHQNHPNPFNPVTTLQYDLPEDAMVSITIYDMMGRVVSNLVSSQQNAGYKSIQWNATNNIGQPVSAGLYLYTIQAGKFRQTKKMVLLK